MAKKEMGEFEERAEVKPAVAVPIERRKPTGLICSVVILAILVVGLAGYIVYDLVTRSNSGDKAKCETVATQKEVDAVNPSESMKSFVGRFYMAGNLVTKERYYFLFDKPQESGDDGFFGGYLDEKAYILDLAASNSDELIREYNLRELIEPLLDRKIKRLPEVLAAGTTNSMPKSDCDKYVVSYDPEPSTQIMYGYDAEKYAVLTVGYTCQVKDDSGKTTLEMGLGAEDVLIDVEGHKVEKTITVDDI